MNYVVVRSYKGQLRALDPPGMYYGDKVSALNFCREINEMNNADGVNGIPCAIALPVSDSRITPELWSHFYES